MRSAVQVPDHKLSVGITLSGVGHPPVRVPLSSLGQGALAAEENTSGATSDDDAVVEDDLPDVGHRGDQWLGAAGDSTAAAQAACEDDGLVETGSQMGHSLERDAVEEVVRLDAFISQDIVEVDQAFEVVIDAAKQDVLGIDAYAFGRDFSKGVGDLRAELDGVIDLRGELQAERGFIAEDVQYAIVDAARVLSRNARGDAGDPDVRRVFDEGAKEIVHAIRDEQNIAAGDEDLAKIIALRRAAAVAGDFGQLGFGQVVSRIVGADAVATVSRAGQGGFDDERSAIETFDAGDGVRVGADVDLGFVVAQVGFGGADVFLFRASVLTRKGLELAGLFAEAQLEIEKLVAQEGRG